MCFGMYYYLTAKEEIKISGRQVHFSLIKKAIVSLTDGKLLTYGKTWDYTNICKKCLYIAFNSLERSIKFEQQFNFYFLICNYITLTIYFYFSLSK